MLNKEPHVAEAVRMLDDITRRMEAHQQKKRATLRKLAVAGEFVGEEQAAGLQLSSPA